MRFSIQKKIKDGRGRTGILETSHGAVETPVFVVVGTRAAVKALTPDEVRELGGEIILANTYHLMLAPGDGTVRDAGGLHAFMGWQGPLMTDSGGFQAYSLGTAYARGMNKFVSRKELEALTERDTADRENAPDAPRRRLATVNEEGILFRSHLDGSAHLLTPERSMDVQHNLGADIIFALDECTSPTDPYDYQKESMERTHRWEERSMARHRELMRTEEEKNACVLARSTHPPFFPQSSQALFGIVQGGPHRDLREESARKVTEMGFDGYGIGGSYTKEDMANVLEWVNPLLPDEAPRHLLGIGNPVQLFMGVEHGVDTFDCVAPAREARGGALYTRAGRVNIHTSVYRRDFTPPDAECSCYTCANFTRSYLAHLFRARELLAYTLATIHNVHFFTSLMRDIRQAIHNGKFFELRDAFTRRYAARRE